jgi:hypothetical protein
MSPEMWAARTLDLARRRLHVGGAAEQPAPAPAEPAPNEPDELVCVVLAFGREEKTRFSAELAASLGPGTPRLDTPDRLCEAITAAIARIDGAGRPIVTRSPAGVYTPEYWRIRVEDADRRTLAELERLAGRRLEP